VPQAPFLLKKQLFSVGTLEELRRIEAQQAQEEKAEKARQDSLMQARIEQKRKEEEQRRVLALRAQARQDSIAKAAQQKREMDLREEQLRKAEAARQAEEELKAKNAQDNQSLDPSKKRIIDNNIRIFKTAEERSEVVSASERAALISRLVVTLKKYDLEELETSDAYGFINFGDGSGNIEVSEKEFYRFRRLFFR